MQQPTKGRAQAAYEKLSTDRNVFLERARVCARYTIPGLVPPAGHTGASQLYQPYQSVGARGVNNLAAKFSLTFLPPNRRFFRLVLPAKLTREMKPEEKSEIETAFVEVEKQIVLAMEEMGIREAFYEGARHLIVAGNVLIYTDRKKKTSRVYPLHQYVVRRDTEGNLMELVILEKVDPASLPKSVQSVVQNMAKDPQGGTKDSDMDVYTHVYRKVSRTGKVIFHVYQEVGGVVIPESLGHYGEGKCPWLALRWSRIDGEDYGRSHCDDYIGDLRSAELLSRSITKFAAVTARLIWLVKRGSSTKIADLVKAEEGAFIPGDKEDVAPLQSDKLADMQVAKMVLDEIISRLSFAFLLNSAARRNGERVTAEEIRYIASELENALGGVQGVLSKEFLLNLVVNVMASMTTSGELPSLEKFNVRPTIIAGVDALGRNHEAEQLEAFLARIAAVAGPNNLPGFLHMDEVSRRFAQAYDVDPKGLVKTAEEISAEQSASMQQGMIEKLGPNAIKAASDQAISQQQTPQ